MPQLRFLFCVLFLTACMLAVTRISLKIAQRGRTLKDTLNLMLWTLDLPRKEINPEGFDLLMLFRSGLRDCISRNVLKQITTLVDGALGSYASLALPTLSHHVEKTGGKKATMSSSQ